MLIKNLNKRTVIVLLVLMFIVGLSTFVYQNRLYTVELSIDGVERTVYYKKMTVQELLDSEEISLELDPFVSEEADTFIENNMKITVTNPGKYTVKLKDNLINVYSFSQNIGEIVEEAGFILDEDDYTNPLRYDEISNGIIEVFKVGKVIEKIQTEIPYQTSKRDNKELEAGKTKVSQAGVVGVKEDTYEVLIVNGVRVEKYLLDETYVKEPVNEIVEHGTKPKIVASRSGSSAKAKAKTKTIKDIPGTGAVGADGVLSDGTSYKKAIVMRSTVYDNSPEQNGGYTTTAMGTPLRRGVVAVDPSVIPLGTKLYIESLDGSPDYGYARAEDKGSAIKGNKIDLCIGSDFTKSYGIRNVKVYILD